MTWTPFEYWRPDGEERRIRIFVSHRHGKDQALYDEVFRALRSNSIAVQDISLGKDQVMRGPRGGRLPKLKLQAEIAARIYTSDVLVAPSRPGVTRSDWVTWEVQLAAIGYGVPILFVNERKLQHKTYLVTEIEGLKLSHAVCDPTVPEIVSSVTGLVDGRPLWTMRQEESDATLRFRGPPESARVEVLKKLPFQPRLSPALDPPPAPKRDFFRFFREARPEV
ncbi:MAG: TIR domain-containing protein [Hyphomonadaceae bacterium]|nr:TIR domain-containing protein [Hyphomonadaceae bacterium]